MMMGHYNTEQFTELFLLCHEKCNMNSSMSTVEFIDYKLQVAKVRKLAASKA